MRTYQQSLTEPVGSFHVEDSFLVNKMSADVKGDVIKFR